MDASLRSQENLMNVTRSSPTDRGETVLNLVFQAAELLSGMEEQVRETEARAQSMCKSAAERTQLAEKRLEVAERARREVINQAERKLQDASKALITAEARIAAAEDKVTAFEFRAQSAEAQVEEAKQALVQVEEAIRERLLNEKKHGVDHRIAKELVLL
jgi:chromosome segregation ATPase